MEAMKCSLLGRVSIPARTTFFTTVVWKGAREASYAALAASRSVISAAAGLSCKSAASSESVLSAAAPSSFSKRSLTNSIALARRCRLRVQLFLTYVGAWDSRRTSRSGPCAC